MSAHKRSKHASKRSDRATPPRVPRPLAPRPAGGAGAEAGAAGGAARANAGPLDLVGQRSMADWPVHEALASEGWDEPGQLSVVVVARRHPSYGTIVLGSFVVDLGCLGVKDAHRIRARDVDAYNRDQRPAMFDHLPPMIAIAPALAAKIVAAGVAYADSLGFKPHRDFTAARAVLAGIDADADPTPVVVGGPDGKPNFVEGPYDDVPAIMAQLRERVGDRGFHFITPLDRLSRERADVLAEEGARDEFDTLDDIEVRGGFGPLLLRCPELADDELSYVDVKGLSGIDDDAYPVVEFYCTDPECDCRRVILHVITDPDEPAEAAINFSWADDGFLRKWLGDTRASSDYIAQIKGPFLEPTTHQGRWSRELLGLVEAQLLDDPAFIDQLQRHYAAFRAAVPSRRKPGGGTLPKRPLWRRLIGVFATF